MKKGKVFYSNFGTGWICLLSSQPHTPGSKEQLSFKGVGST